MDKHVYDVIIIGGGPAGYTAALYLARAGLNAIVLEKMVAGGQMSQTSEIDNYPGFDEGIDGFSLGQQMQRGAQKFGATTEIAEVISVKIDDDIKEIITSETKYLSKAIIIATGARPRKLGLKGEDELIGKGIGYCAVCDGMFYKGKDVVVVGGGNSALEDAIYLSRLCNKVIIVHRRDSFRASRIYREQIKDIKNIHICMESEIKEFKFDDILEGVKIYNSKKNEYQLIKVEGVFISIGREPVTNLWKDILDLDENGYIIANESTKTNIPGVFVAGDVRTKELRQIVTATSDGAIAAYYAEDYINKLEDAKLY